MDLLSRDADKACRGIKLNILKQEAGEIYRMQTTIETSANERTNDKVLQRKSIEVDAQCESQIWANFIQFQQITIIWNRLCKTIGVI